MEEKAIIFNGGRDQDIEPLEGADQFLTRLLGAAPSRPAVPYLRVVQSSEGQQCVGVFIGAEHVGYLQPTDPEVLATVKACELNGAVARARGNLTASWEHPGKVNVRVNLADPEYLLCEPELQEQDLTDVPLASVDEGPADEGPVDEGLVDASFATPEIWTAIESAAEPALTAGLDQDYPEWPPPKAKSLAPTPPAAASEPTVADEPLQSVEPDPMTPQAPTGVSPQALLSTRSAWMGGPPAQPAGQTGWLGSAAKPTQSPSLGTVTSTPLGGASSGLAGATSASGAAPSETRSWQDMAETTGGAARTPDEEIIAAWTSSRPATQTVTSVTPVKSPRASGTSKTWLLSALAVVVLVAAAFLVWKFVFAPKTYTDDQYGYSFTYPGRWDTADDGEMPVGTPPEFADVMLFLDASLAGYGEDFSDDFAAVGVFLFDLKIAMSAADLQAGWEMGFAQAVQESGGTYSLLEPMTSVAMASLQGVKVTVRFPAGLTSVDVEYRFLVDGTRLYELVVMTPTDSWGDRQKAFDAFFNSFKPGTAQI